MDHPNASLASPIQSGRLKHYPIKFSANLEQPKIECYSNVLATLENCGQLGILNSSDKRNFQTCAKTLLNNLKDKHELTITVRDCTSSWIEGSLSPTEKDDLIINKLENNLGYPELHSSVDIVEISNVTVENDANATADLIDDNGVDETADLIIETGVTDGNADSVDINDADRTEIEFDSNDSDDLKDIDESVSNLDEISENELFNADVNEDFYTSDIANIIFSGNNENSKLEQMELEPNEDNGTSSTEQTDETFREESQTFFAKKLNIADHVRQETDDLPFSCEYCGVRFKIFSTLERHHRTHTGEKQFSCDQCGKCFTRQSGLRQHLNIHAGLRPYTCDYCQKTFTHQSVLVHHTRIHTGVRPYSCHICQKRFVKMSYLRDHLRTHTGERPYMCPQCPLNFAQRSTYQKHVAKHKLPQ